MVSAQQYVEPEMISTEDLTEEIVDGTDVFQETDELLSEDIKIEECVEDGGVVVNGIVEEQEGEEEEEAAQETFLCENIFASSDMTKAFEDEDVFVNEVTIEEGKEDPIDVSQE